MTWFQKEFCPPIDTSLFFALSLDYDLQEDGQYEQLRELLENLKQSAVTEEHSTFDPSGSSHIQDELAISRDSSDLAQSWHGDLDSNSGDTEGTDITNLSNALKESSLGSRSAEAADLSTRANASSPADNARILKDMFPDVKDFDMDFVLKKVHNDFDKAIEELLTQAFIDEEHIAGGEYIPRKGIEGFSDPVNGTRRKKGKGRKTRLLRRTSSMSEGLNNRSTESPSPLSRWDRAREDVEFIAQRTHLSMPSISSTYHKCGGSLSLTIATLCEPTQPNCNPLLADAAPVIIDAHTTELVVDFPSISHTAAAALIGLTHPSTASAHELCRAMLSPASRSSSAIVPQYARRPPSPIRDTATVTSSGTALPSSMLGGAEALANQRNRAYLQAQAAHRKSKSNHLMGGAAAYYGSVSRDASASLRNYQTAEADQLVDAQSRVGEVDLHGVSVQDAVRIASERVSSWWETEAQEYSGTGKSNLVGIRLVTGQGHHSQGGKGRIGPAVARTLVKQGWKVEIGQGVIDVIGKVRK